MTEYVKEMRKIIGKRPLLLCGASVIIVNDRKQVLLLRRSDNNCWCFPGGAVDLGEQVEESAIREVKEETNLDINIDDLKVFHVFSGKELHYVYPHGDEVYIVDVVFITNEYAGLISTDEESKEYKFFDIEHLPQDISPPVIPVVERLKEKYIEIEVFND